MNSVAIIGTGAIGGYYGALLAQSGLNVQFLLNSDYEYVRENGLFIESPNGSISLKEVNAWNNASDMPACDLVIVTLKTTLNNLLPSILPQVCHQHSKVLVLQNGLGTDKDSSDVVPNNEVFGGVCSIAANKVGPGHIKHIAYNEIRMGQYLKNNQAVGISQSLTEISSLLNSAGISTVLSEDISEARWRKLIWNMAFNGLSTVLNCDTQTIMTTPKYRQRAISIMKEVLATALACGLNIEEEFIDSMIKLTDDMAPYNPSMKLDYDNNRPMELEVIYKRPINEAKRSNCKIPEIEKLCSELLELEGK